MWNFAAFVSDVFEICPSEISVLQIGIAVLLQIESISEPKKEERNVGIVFGRVFLKTAANGYLKMIHSYSRFSLGTHRDHSQLHRMSGSGFSRFFLYIFANLYCLYLENKTLFRKSGSVTLHHLSPSNFIQKRGKICLAVSEILRTN